MTSPRLELIQDELPDEIIVSSSEESSLSFMGINPEPAYDSDEHKDIGNYVIHMFMEQLKTSHSDVYALLVEHCITVTEEFLTIYNPFTGKKEKLPRYEVQLNNGLSITPGEVVALAGDFYGIANKPISFGETLEEQKVRFEAAFNKLFHTDADENTVNKLIAHIQDHTDANQEHANWKVKFKKAIRDITVIPIADISIGDIEYQIDTTPPNSDFWHGNYFPLATSNFDHFGKDAQTAYLVGHHIAVNYAKQASLHTKEIDISVDMLRQAILRELFACHFLTDLFAAGHIRTPRRQLLNHIIQSNAEQNTTSLNATPDLNNVSSTDLTIAGFLAKKMHDRDGKSGVWVSAPMIESPWLAYGDGNYYDERNKKNAQIACYTMAQALQDLINVFVNVNPLLINMNDTDTLSYGLLQQYIPAELTERNELDRKPLFKYDEASNSIISPSSQEHIIDRLPLQAVSLFKVTVKKAQETKELAAEAVLELKNQLKEAKAKCSIM